MPPSHNSNPNNGPHNNVELVKLAEAGSHVAAIELKMLLNRLGVPYMVKNENLQNLIGYGSLGGYNFAVGPIEFWVRKEHFAEARRGLLQLRETHPTQVPAQCPACGADNPQQALHCPGCGLFLG